MSAPSTTDVATQATGSGVSGRARSRHGRLFLKYVLLFVGVVSTALAASGGLQIWFAYSEQLDSLAQIQRVQAEATAGKIGQFIQDIQGQIGWTTQLPWTADSVDQRRFDALRLLRQVPAITELAQFDSTGREQLKVSRLARDVIGSMTDFSQDPKFTEAVARKSYFGPVYFRRESEPYMSVSQAGARRDAGVSVAEVNLKFIWDLVSQIKVGKAGAAYLVDNKGRLIAHPDISLVLRNTDVSALPQVKAIIGGVPNSRQPIGADLQANEVVTATAKVADLGWQVFVDLPLKEALAPIYASMIRTGGLLLVGLGVAFLAGLFLARRMVVPIRTLQLGAAQIGGGDLGRRISIRTGDELEGLAESFNDMAGRLAESHAQLEQRVIARTEELARSVAELRALGEVSRAVNSTLDLQTVLTTIVAKAVQLSGTEAGGIHEFDHDRQEFQLTATYGSTNALTAEINALHIRAGETAIGEATTRREPVQIADLALTPPSAVRELLERGGYRAVLAIPLLRGDEVMGALVVRRRSAGLFDRSVVDLLQTFAAQSVIAIQNARLFSELEEKGRQLELASQHKSQFLANMSHELRTPLNAILGYTELILDSIYGPIGDRSRQVLERVQLNGKHLLGLINDVLDLSKIEAGQLTLALGEYNLASVAQAVVSATESLAKSKGLDLRVSIGADLPIGRGDERRLTQVLLNLMGNAIKFTDQGFVEIGARRIADRFEIWVKDSGPGIAPADQDRIFGEFQQVDSSSTRSKGGSGLGLAISRRIVGLHGGTIRVESTLGTGSTFWVSVPIAVESTRVAA